MIEEFDNLYSPLQRVWTIFHIAPGLGGRGIGRGTRWGDEKGEREGRGGGGQKGWRYCGTGGSCVVVVGDKKKGGF